MRPSDKPELDKDMRTCLHMRLNAASWENLSLGFLTRFDTIQAVQSQKMYD